MIGHPQIPWEEWRWVVVASLAVVAVSSIPYLVAWSQESPERIFSGCILLVEDCYSYLGKMRQGADGAWLFHISYTPEEHPGALFFPFHLLLGKTASLLPGRNLTGKIVLVYHLARVIFGLGLLLVVYRFFTALTERVMTRRLAWLMVAVGGGFGWLLSLLGQTRWLGDAPLDLVRSEAFAFITLYGFPHKSAAQSLLFGGFLCLLQAWELDGASYDIAPYEDLPDGRASSLDGKRHDLAPRLRFRLAYSSPFKWAILAGLLWLLMGLIVPFYVVVAWTVVGAAWAALCLRHKPAPALLPYEALVASVSAVLSAPIVAYAVWIFTTEPVYAAWAAQNQILSPHPLHYLAAYGPPLALAAFAAKDTWHDRGKAWFALAWVTVVPLLVYLPVNIQFRLLTGFQVPLSLLAARGATRLWDRSRRGLVLALLLPMIPTNLLILASSSIWMTGQPFPSFRDGGEIAVLDWLAARAQPGDVILTAYDTGAYLPARVHARVLAGHDLEAVQAEEKREQIDRFFDSATEEAWRKQFLTTYRVDYVFWGPAERHLGDFDPDTMGGLSQVYQVEEYSLFTVEP
jgi:hypothetical protein